MPPLFVYCKSYYMQVDCPWGLGQWQGDWSHKSALWERYPSVAAELKQGEAPAFSTAGEAAGSEGEGNGAEGPVLDRARTSFWMSFEDFSTEFSQARQIRRKGVETGGAGSCAFHIGAIWRRANVPHVTKQTENIRRGRGGKMCVEDCSVNRSKSLVDVATLQLTRCQVALS